MATASATLSPVTLAAATVISPGRRTSVNVKYISGLNAFGGLKAHNNVVSLGLPVCTEQSFAKVVSSLRAPSKGKGGGALSSTCNAVGEIFRIAAIMNGLVLVGVAVGYLMLICMRVELGDRTLPAAAWSPSFFGKNQLIHRKLGSLADEYGPAYLISLGIHRALVVSGWEVIKECFTTYDKVFPTRPRTLAAKLMGYDHTLMGSAPYGPYWRHTRKIATVERLSNRRLELLKHVREAEINNLLKELYEESVKSGGVAVVQMREKFTDLAMNVIVKMMTGKRYGGPDGRNDEESKRCQKALNEFFYLAGLFTVSDAVPVLGWIDVLTGTISKFKRTAKELDYVLGSWVNEHRERRLAGDTKGDKDFIDVMLSILDDGKTSTKEADITIKATCQSLLLGGNDTTVLTLTWALSLLLNNRHALKKAQDELETQVGRDRQVEESDMKNLPYLHAIVKEALRLYPAAPLSPREAMEDCTVAGFHVPAGTRLIVNLWKMMRDPNVWEKPSEFVPERFLNEHAKFDVRGQDFEFVPFGSRRRMCPGATFALQILHLTLARLIHGFELGKVSDKPVDMTESPALTLPKATPLEVTVTPRLSSNLYAC
ncbi:Cytochrome P450 82C4, putative isoform 1 [Theobroma cacao]|uniref:Cytochrome P450 82C4, putative isoform 1 n=1 Tax=Theobroma cacao TaxID=3641 RepID=A0A061DYR7_THECC|nr:Cytochrome P450 82C4, putative isoform 1 [Theobroma cacao]